MRWDGPLLSRRFTARPMTSMRSICRRSGRAKVRRLMGMGCTLRGMSRAADYYRQALSGGGVNIVKGGENIGQIPGTNVVNDPKFVAAYQSLIPADVPDWIKSGVLRDIRGAGDIGQNVDLSAARQTSLDRLKQEALSTGSADFHQKASDAINKAYDSIGGNVQFRAPGHMYEVNLNVEPQQLLDWDKTMGQQSPQAQRALSGISDRDFRPEDLGQHLVPNRPDMTSQYAKSGIPGIQYLDQGSRSAGEGSRNYVMFDPKLIDIVRKYGLAGAMLGLPASAPFMQQTPSQ